MELLEGLKTRRSVRRYTDELISHELFEEIIDTAKMAPTWKNTQTLRYILIQNEEIIKKICDDCLLGFEHNAKTLSKCKNLVVLTQVNGRCGYEKDGSFSTSKGTGWEMFDAGVSAEAFCLAAHTYGVGTVILGYADYDKIKELLGLPEAQEVVAIIAMGYHETNNPAPARLSVSELLNFVE